MKEEFFLKLERLITEAKRLLVTGFSADQEPEEATKQLLLEPLFQALGFAAKSDTIREFKILGDSVDYLLKSDRPLLFVEAKSVHDCPKASLFDKHREQVLRYIQNYRLSPEITKMENPVKWILLANFAQFHFIRVNEIKPTFSFKLEELWARREELWEMLALENLDASRLDELYDQQLKACLDQQFLADLKRWRLLIANGFALRNPKRSLQDITLASQQLLDRFIFCRMLETRRLVEYNKLARTYSTYEVLYARADATFAEIVRRSLFIEIKNDFNTELFEQPLLCDELDIDNAALAAVVGHEPLAPDLAATCGFESGQGELLAFRHLYSYDFSLMSQDVMGAVYERFLAHKLFQEGGRLVIEDTDELRKKEGIYYTPQYIVDYIVQHTLGEKIKPILAEAKTLLGYKNFKAALAKIRELQNVKVLDPAMGSGSFLLRAFDALVRAYEDYNQECRRIKKERNGHGALFDADFALAEEVFDAPLHVLTENIFGVDLDRQAVEVAKLSLWLRYMAVNRDPFLDRIRRKRRGDKPLNLLPNLTNNFKRGNSLIDDINVAGDAAFDWAKEFPEIMKCGGFDVVISNPPYGAYLDEVAKSFLNQHYACQSYQLDSYLLFLERSIKTLLRDAGHFGMIIPNPWLTNILQQNTRRFVTQNAKVQEIVHFLFPVFTGVTVDTEILLLKKAEPEQGVALVTIAETQAGFEKFQLGEGITQIQHEQDVWRGLDGGIINIFLTKADGKLKAKIASKGITADSLLEINVGIKPYQVGKGTPPQTQKIVDERSFDSLKKLDKSYRLYLRGSDIDRYAIAPLEDRFIKYGPWLAEPRPAANFEAPVKILVRQTGDSLVAALDEHQYLCLNNLHVLVPKAKKMDVRYILGILNSKVLNWYYQSLNPEAGEALAEVKRTNVAALPIRAIDVSVAKDRRELDFLVQMVNKLLQAKKKEIVPALVKALAHSQRTPCNLAHYLQKDFAAAVTAEILIDDVQRTGFVHEIKLEPEAKHLTLIASVAQTPDSPPCSLPVLKMSFRDDVLRNFIYACWRHFLAEHSRQRRWTKGKKAEQIYSLLVNTLEPLVYFNPAASDNIRAVHDLMKAVAQEAGTADLAALESEIKKLDSEIDAFVYELYGLTENEIKIVEGV
jgi:type I restriction-modification system DNA methylase subunit